ncbi:ester cyclase [uncultured Chitinophaga sp.]|uniref:ester cyclase n=1 Tax=uncultured Chitinophaga sp. TaxID=339340 RepID=UPI0025CE17E7|nr:ester cyclase [uncultured Chitinophaga sp.]
MNSRTLLLIALLLPAGYSVAQHHSTKKEQVMTNKPSILSLYQDCLNKHRFDLLNDYISPDYTAINGVKGPTGFASTTDAIVKAFPDAQWIVEEVIAEGEKVYIRWKFEGTHTGGTFQQIAPTGKKVSNTGMGVYTFRDGKVVATNVFTDRLMFMQQLGVLPVDLGK